MKLLDWLSGLLIMLYVVLVGIVTLLYSDFCLERGFLVAVF